MSVWQNNSTKKGLRVVSQQEESLLDNDLFYLLYNFTQIPPAIAELPIQKLHHINFRPSKTNSQSVEWPILFQTDKVSELIDVIHTKLDSGERLSDSLSTLDRYPIYNSLLDIVTSWNPDNPEIPLMFRESLQHFNYSDPHELKLAVLFRTAEIPFKLYDIPDIDSTVSKWTDTYLSQVLKTQNGIHIERSKDNHFMYWSDAGKRAS